MLFKRNPLKKYFRQFRKNTRRELRAIKKIADHSERLARYEALERGIEKLYKGGEPKSAETSGTGATAYGMGAGALIGFFAVAVVGSLFVPPIGVTISVQLVSALAIGLGLGVAGAIGGGLAGGLLGALIDTGEQRKKARAEYGSVRNAHAMHGLKNLVQQKVKEEKETTRALDHVADLQRQFDEASGRKAPSAAPQLTTAQTPAQPAI